MAAFFFAKLGEKEKALNPKISELFFICYLLSRCVRDSNP